MGNKQGKSKKNHRQLEDEWRQRYGNDAAAAPSFSGPSNAQDRDQRAANVESRLAKKPTSASKKVQQVSGLFLGICVFFFLFSLFKPPILLTWFSPFFLDLPFLLSLSIQQERWKRYKDIDSAKPTISNHGSATTKG